MTRTLEHLRRRLPALLARPTAVLLALAALAVCLYALIPSLHTVYVTDASGNTKVMISRETEPAILLQLAETPVQSEDAFYYTAYANNVENISVQHELQVGVDADDSQYVAAVTGGTVGDVLARMDVTLNEHDYTEPSWNTPVSQDMTIAVHRVEYQDSITTESIPFETEYQYSSLFYRNKSRTMTVQNGSEGTNEITWRERWVDGTLESSQRIAVVTTVEPKNTIIKSYGAGAPVSALTGPNGTTEKPTSYRAMYTGRATGYSARIPRGASGRRLSYGTCAVNPAQIPYGTLLYIESTDGRFVYGYAIAADTGGALMNGTCLVDLFYETYAESVINAVQQVNVYVVG